jgi:Tfp pilus assembly protein PilP
MKMKLAQVQISVLAALAISLFAGSARAQKKPVRSSQAASANQAPRPEATAAENPATPKRTDLEGKRDPFVSLIRTSKGDGRNLPPGVGGLVIATVAVEGTVQTPGGMLAVLSNPQQRVYFVRDGEHLYDGDVEKITLDGVTFLERSKDAFGRPIERTVTKRIYATAGEQQ